MICGIKILIWFVIAAALISAWLWKVNAVCDYMLDLNGRCSDIITEYVRNHNMTEDTLANVDDMITIWHEMMDTPYSKMIWSFKPLADESFFSERQLKFLNKTLYI